MIFDFYNEFVNIFAIGFISLPLIFGGFFAEKVIRRVLMIYIGTMLQEYAEVYLNLLQIVGV